MNHPQINFDGLMDRVREMHEEDPRIADLYEMLQQIEPDDENDTFDEAENEVVANHDDMAVGPMAKLKAKLMKKLQHMAMKAGKVAMAAAAGLSPAAPMAGPLAAKLAAMAKMMMPPAAGGPPPPPPPPPGAPVIPPSCLPIFTLTL